MSDPYSDENHMLGIADCSCYLCTHLKTGGQLPGKGASRKRFNAFIDQRGQCFYCGDNVPSWEQGVMEHIIPKSKGGKKTVFACKECDKVKASYATPEEYNALIARLEKIRDCVAEVVQ